jgi:hypothetical protein
MREARRLQAEAQDRQEEAQARYFETQSAANAATALQHTAALAPGRPGGRGGVHRVPPLDDLPLDDIADRPVPVAVPATLAPKAQAVAPPVWTGAK